MLEQYTKESQKTVVAFIAGLLVGGLLVWVFSATTAETPNNQQDDETAVEATDETSDKPAGEVDATTDKKVEKVLNTGEGSAQVGSQVAGSVVKLDSATFPSDEGWVVVRTYSDDQLGSILGASRYSKDQGLVPESVELLVPMIKGNTYAIVFFNEDGNKVFNLDGDSQIDTKISTFTAN